MIIGSQKKTKRARSTNPKAKSVCPTSKTKRRKPQAQRGIPKHTEKSTLKESLLVLEPRILFDGAALVTGAEVTTEQLSQQDTETTISSESQSPDTTTSANAQESLFESLTTLDTPSDRREIVFIDTSVEDYQTLVEGFDSNAEVVLLDATRDGIEQIAEVLQGRTGLDAIHIVSHGDQGELRLGTGVLNLASMQGEYADELIIINQALTDSADFLIYGCNFGEGEVGQEAAARLAQLTGADIAASDDLTGNAALGGDWDLEVSTGTIESSIVIGEASQAAWEGLLAIYTVTNTNDAGAGSLRQAIIDANTNAGVTDTIDFNIAGPGPHTITPTSALETITDAVIIDGYTQTGTSANTLAVGNDAVLQIEIDGNLAGVGASGLHITGGNSTVRGLAIHSFDGDGIAIEVNDGNLIEGNFIGTDVSGTAPGLGNEDGVDIDMGSSNNTIGGTTAAARNIISGNTDDGVDLDGVNGNTVIGNYIGTTAAGTGDLGNTNNGVFVKGGASNNTIGGTTVGARNVISGNNDSGIQLNGAGVAGNTIQGNYIGTNAAGTAAVSNSTDGIEIISSNNVTIGGTTAAARNIISGNNDDGVNIDAGSTGLIVQGNYIGLDVTGTSTIANADDGVLIEVGSSNNTIGGTTAAARNFISGNGGDGIEVTDSDNNTIHGNIIGQDTNGTARGNTNHGIYIRNTSSNNLIGGTTAGAGNTITNNGLDGIAGNSTGTGNAIQRNSIFNNAGLGIDLNNDGITANDAGDGDTGTNNLQNFPAINQAATDGLGIVLQGTVQSSSSTTFRVEFFSTSTADGSGYGEGQTYLGFVNVTTNASGQGSFNTLLAAPVAAGASISATATNLTTNDTSEFALSLTAVAAPPPPPVPGPDPGPEPEPEPEPDDSESSSDPISENNEHSESQTSVEAPTGLAEKPRARSQEGPAGTPPLPLDTMNHLAQAARHLGNNPFDTPQDFFSASLLSPSLDIPTHELSKAMARRLDLLADALEQAWVQSQSEESFLPNIAKGSGLTLSAGYVAWLLRGGSLLTSLLATLPVSTYFDPLPVLSAGFKKPKTLEQEAQAEMDHEDAEFEGLSDIFEESDEPTQQTMPTKGAP